MDLEPDTSFAGPPRAFLADPRDGAVGPRRCLRSRGELHIRFTKSSSDVSLPSPLLQTLLPPAIVLATCYRPSVAIPVSPSISIAAVCAPLLAGVALYNTTASPLYLSLALGSQMAAAVGLTALRSSWAESRGARSNEVFKLLYQASPVGFLYIPRPPLLMLGLSSHRSQQPRRL
jgi:hypothetical protein